MSDLEQDLDFSGVPDQLDDDGKRVWVSLTPPLMQSGRFRDTDNEVLTRYCDMVGRYWRMSKRVRDEGETIMVPTIARTADGKPGQMARRHPLLAEMKSLLPELRQIEDRMGMSPLSRANLVSKLLGAPRSPNDLPADSGQDLLADPDGPQQPLVSDPANFH